MHFRFSASNRHAIPISRCLFRETEVLPSFSLPGPFPLFPIRPPVLIRSRPSRLPALSVIHNFIHNFRVFFPENAIYPS